MRFRVFQIVINSDIEKMYRQVLLHPNDKYYQLIYWRENPNEPLNVYKLRTVTYGITSSSFLAVRCVNQLAQEFSHLYPTACKTITRDMYIDDYLSGCDTIEEAKILKQEVSTILSRGGFNLTKWSSNNANVLENNETIINTQSISLNMEGQLKTLGLFWDCKSNTLNYKAQIGNPKLTKRGILSSISKIFDPLGLLSPIVIKSKMLLQEMWKNKLRWDEPISHEIQQAWLNLTKDLNELNDIKIPRKVVPAAGAKIELHGFCDASQKAYGAVIYLKTIYENKVTTQLLVSKSRVAPL